MVLDFHAEGNGADGYFGADATHADDSKSQVPGVVAEGEGGAAPGVGAHGTVGDVDAAEGAEEEEYCYVGCCTVDGDGGGRDEDS